MPGISSFKFTIRVKLLLLSVVILSIPYIGFEYLRELETYLRDALDVSMVDAARATAGPLHERDELFQNHDDNPVETLYVHEMSHSVQLDGYAAEDWESYIAWSDLYQSSAESKLSDSLSYKLIVGRYQQTLYVLIQVKDGKLSYQKAAQPDSTDNDHVMLVMTDQHGQHDRYYFSPAAPGKIRPFTSRTAWDEFRDEYTTIEYVTNISGEWQTSKEGYNLEIAIPVNLLGDRLGIVVTDNDGDEVIKLGTNGTKTAARPGRLLQSSREIGQIITSLGQNAGRRVWVLNHHAQVLASHGSLDRVLPESNRNIFYSMILPPLSTRVRDDLTGKSRLQGDEIKQALAGNTETRWRSSPDGKAVIVSAATPIWINEEVRGVVMVEESSIGIQMLRRSAMVSLFNKTLLIFVIVTSLLLIFATRLSSRIKRLSQQANSATDEHGRVVGKFHVDTSEDEIGELSRNYSSMLDRLKEYNHYLEKMAGRLSHEFRTPIAIVQSSLEHLQSSESVAEPEQYLARARQGIDRLNLILTRLSEATRLENAMQSAEKDNTDINQLLINCVCGYRLAYPQKSFELKILEKNISNLLAPDLFVQMLDKLISNAVDFGVKGEPILLELEQNKDTWQVAVISFGSTLPADMEIQLFNSMISVREKNTDQEPHLGLGLYIVRLIVEYMDGSVIAHDLPMQAGVKIVVKLPL
jgi:two-component system, OmpR family, sensor histidine kinase ChvG